MRIVLDSNVLIRAHGRRSAAACELLRLAVNPPNRLVLSNEIISEVVRVLRYPRFRWLYGLSEEALLEYAQYLRHVGDLVQFDPQYRAPLRDRSDLAILQAADQGCAELLCTQDQDFFDESTRLFCASRGIVVCDERAALARLRPV